MGTRRIRSTRSIASDYLELVDLIASVLRDADPEVRKLFILLKEIFSLKTVEMLYEILGVSDAR